MAACRDTGYDWFEQLLQNVSITFLRYDTIVIRILAFLLVHTGRRLQEQSYKVNSVDAL